ncbi:hypothetical protein [Actinophytocola gossypii]|uniref:Uncharacterized protein n=1 Tax=Actinophytocola gossypii TaxID=2812003 RepID=A0ABT2JJX4_9PSEU|nr:hypothetical protein [Actinophytocola gossypii]MCT2588193.1 hypothetical protein [Actinophytocola gossypii]
MTNPAHARHRPAAPDAVIRSADLRASGLTQHAIAVRCRPSGPWQRLLPGVVLLSNTPPTRRQRVRAALTYAGAEAVLTGTDAITAHGVPVPQSDEVLVLVPAARRATSRSYVTVERTTRLPTPVRRNGLPTAPLARATTDAARHERDRERLRTTLFAPVQAGSCTIADLRQELNVGNQRGSAGPRALLADKDHEVVPFIQALATRLLRSAPLPPPRWQVPLHTAKGTKLGVADAWWPEAGLAWNLGAQHHPLPTTEQAKPLLAAAGITVLHTDPARLSTHPTDVVAELVDAFTYASKNPHRR